MAAHKFNAATHCGAEGRAASALYPGTVRTQLKLGDSQAYGTPSPFIFCGNGGYHNLHKITLKPADAVSDAALKYDAANFGFMTLGIGEETISGRMFGVDKSSKGAKFISTARPFWPQWPGVSQLRPTFLRNLPSVLEFLYDAS